MRLRELVPPALLSGLLALGCGKGAAPPESDASGGSDGSLGSDASGGSNGDGSSECSGDFDVYQAGMSRQAEPGAITVELVESVPAPPVVRSDNTWWLK